MTRTARPLPQSFQTWLDLSTDDELIRLAALVAQALARRGFVPSVQYVKPAA